MVFLAFFQRSKERKDRAGVKSLCAVCGTQGIQTFSSRCPAGRLRYPAGRIGDRGDREIFYVPIVAVPFPAPMIESEISRRGHWKRGICINFSEIDFQIRDKFATILLTLPLMYETKCRQFCANWTRNLRQICATPPSRTPPSRDF